MSEDKVEAEAWMAKKIADGYFYLDKNGLPHPKNYYFCEDTQEWVEFNGE